MSSFVFKDTDILNTTLLPTESYMGNFPYTVSTTSSRFLGNKITTLAPVRSYPGANGGSIDWREGTFTVGDVTRKRVDIKRRVHGLFSISSTREWRWSGHTYTVKKHDNQWTATPNVSTSSGSGVPISSAFTPVKASFFRMPNPAAISFSPDLPQIEVVFLTLVMLYSETRRHERNVPPNAEIPMGMQR